MEYLVVAAVIAGLILLVIEKYRGDYWHYAKISILWQLKQAVMPLSVNRFAGYTQKHVTKVLAMLLKEHLITDEVILDGETYYIITQEGEEWLKEHS